MNYNETKIQQAMYAWILSHRQKFKGIDRVHAHNNEGKRSPHTARALKLAGLIPGISDLEIPPPVPTLFIEVKDEGKYQSPSQKEYEDKCLERGDVYAVCRNIEDLEIVVNAYYQEHFPEAILL